MTPTPIAFAHRGGTDGGFPENSLVAFADALARGAHLESDVRLSVDGIPVLVHDAWWPWHRVPVPVRLTTARALARHGVPSLADLLGALGADFELSLDIKELRAARPAIDVVRAGAHLSRVWLVHDSVDELRALREYDDEVRLVHEARPPAGPGTVEIASARARELASRGINAENRHWRSWLAPEVDAAHAHGIAAFGSLVHTVSELDDAASRSLDALYSDHVSALVAAIAAHSRRG